MQISKELQEMGGGGGEGGIWSFFKIMGFHNLLQFTFKFKLLFFKSILLYIKYSWNYTLIQIQKNINAKGILGKFIFQRVFSEYNTAP